MRETIKNISRALVTRDAEQTSLAIADLKESVRLSNLWFYLGWQDVKQRYRRSFLGPFWITLSMLLFIIIIGYLNSALFNRPLGAFVPYLCIGYIIWDFIAQLINEGTSVFIGSGNLIRQMSLPLSFHVLRHVARYFYILLHNSILIFLVLFAFDIPQTINSLFSLLGFFFLFLNVSVLSMLVGVFSTRFRDMQQLIKSVMQILFFFTPVVWPMEVLPQNRKFLADINPFYYMIEAIRSPLLGSTLPVIFWIKLFVVTFVFCFLAVFIFIRYRRRIAYWL